jgi:DNA-directed RNA polymerase subunit omega
MVQKLSTENLTGKDSLCRYSLIIGVSKRARQIAERNEELGIQCDEKPVITAAKEYADGEFDIVPIKEKAESEEE